MPEPPPANDPTAPAAGETPAPPAAEPPGAIERENDATIERSKEHAEVFRQHFVTDVRQRQQEARAKVNASRPDEALYILKNALNFVRTSDVDEATRGVLERELQGNLLATQQAEERIDLERAQGRQLEAAAEQRVRALGQLQRNQSTVNTLMIQFDSLMAQGQYNVLANGGLGDIAATTAPFSDARLLAQAARALEPNNPAPRAGMFVAQTMGFLAQSLAFEQIKEYRFMLSLQDIDRAVDPLPRHHDDRVSRRRAVAGPLRAPDQALRQGRRPARPRPQDQVDPGQARRTDLDVVRQRDAA